MNLISIVTPTYKNTEYIEECLLSVLNQKGDFSIEHIVVDSASSESMVKILKEFEQKILSGELVSQAKEYKFKWISEKDEGMYDAILKGFKMSSGDIMAWINDDDKYQEGAFEYVSTVFNNNPKILWFKGITDYIEKDGTTKKGFLNNYNQKLISHGFYGQVGKYIQQDSVFWKRELWESVNHDEIKQYRLAGDFRLWQLFAQKTKLYSFNKHVSYFRKREGQLSSNSEKYVQEMNLTTKITPLEKNIYGFLDKIEKTYRKLIFRNQ